MFTLTLLLTFPFHYILRLHTKQPLRTFGNNYMVLDANYQYMSLDPIEL